MKKHQKMIEIDQTEVLAILKIKNTAVVKENLW